MKNKNKSGKKLESILPSKKFVITMGICLGFCILIIGFVSFFGTHSAFSKPALSVEDNITLQDLLTQDSNNNGIPDWEETLYGLDPKADGIKNKQIIDEKKMEVAKTNGADLSASTSTTDTQALAQEMISTILALKQSGNLTSDSINNLSTALGDNLNGQRDNPTPFSIDNMNIVDDSSSALKDYTSSFENILGDAQKNDIGNELAVINQGLDPSTGKDDIKMLDNYVSVYDKFANNIIALKTPRSISQKALALANSCELMSKALSKIELMYVDSTSGLIGFDEYGSVSFTVASDLADLTMSLEK